MVLCSPQVDSSFALDGISVAEIPFRNILGANQQTYERLKMALSLNLRRQIFIAVCDDLPLRDRFAVQLQSELAHVSVVTSSLTSASLTAEPRAIPKLVTLDLDLLDPNPLAQVAEWLTHVPKGRTGRPAVTPAFQVLGIERLTRQSAAIQSVFLSYLQNIEQQLPLIESCLVLWMTQPWFRMLPEAVPEFWHCRTGVFEFIGDPTPLPVTSPERIQLDSPGALGQSRDLSSSQQPPLDNPDRSAASLIENPWIPLAKDLNYLYEPDPNTDPYRNVAANSEPVTTDDDQPSFDPWMIASGQVAQPLSAQEQALSELKENGQSYAALSVARQPFVDANLVDAQPDRQLESLSPTQPNLNGTSVDQVDQNQGSDTAIFDLGFDLLTQEVEIGQTIPLLQHIESLQQQIESLHQGQESPVVLANAYRTLGNFYRDCIEQGEASVENLTLAIQAYEQALQWLSENPLERAEIFNDLGNLYWMIAQIHSSTEDATVFLQQTVQVYQLALQNFEPQQHIQLYAMVQNNLGATYADLARYQDPAVNLQLSIDAYQRALQHRAAELDLLRYASTQNNLGTTYWNFAQHQQPAINLKHAIAAYSEAIRCYVPEQDPLNYAMIQNNLGTAYWNLAQYGQTQENLTLALIAYQDALRYRTLETAPTGFAATQNNLGTAFWHLANHSQQPTERLSYLQQAIAAYEAALQAAIYIQNHQPEAATLNFDIASTQNNLGLAHFQIATDTHTHLSAADVAFHLEGALKHHILALQSWETQPELRQTAISCILQTIRACYQQQGLSGQNQALSQVPSRLLAEILPKL